MAYRLLVVDDEIMLTNLLFHNFTDNGYEVYIANDGKSALKLLEKNPDLVLLDINMPEMDGWALCKNIREHIMCPILFLTARITEQDKVYGFRCGGDDYITKPFSLPELNARVEAHIKRDERNRNNTKIKVTQDLIVDVDKRIVSWNGETITFSKKEFDIIEFLLLNANQVFDRETIYERVWGLEADGDSSVVKEHIRRIRIKLQEKAGKSYIDTVWGMGYKWEK